MLEEYGRLRAVLKRRVRVEGAVPKAVAPLDHGRLCSLAVETGAGTILCEGRGNFVSIGERTSDNGVRVRQKGFSRCTAGFPYVAGRLEVPVPLAYRLCRTGDTGSGRERPPPFGPSGSAPGGSLPSKNPCRKAIKPMRRTSTKILAGAATAALSRTGWQSRAESFESVPGRIGELGRCAHGPECAHAIVADMPLGWLQKVLLQSILQ